jgi:hypothetical protein
MIPPLIEMSSTNEQTAVVMLCFFLLSFPAPSPPPPVGSRAFFLSFFLFFFLFFVDKPPHVFWECASYPFFWLLGLGRNQMPPLLSLRERADGRYVRPALDAFA